MEDADDPCSISELLERARARLDRVEPDQLEAEMAAGALVVDTRPAEQRQRDGELPGAIVICRNVLEWRLDPASDHRIEAARSHDLRVVIVCNEGYSSSLAASGLHDLGLTRATDLVGGFQAWRSLDHRSAKGAATDPECTLDSHQSVRGVMASTASGHGGLSARPRWAVSFSRRSE